MDDLVLAVRNLRSALGDSQQAFATRLGLSLRAIANYEGGREPTGRALAQMMNLAASQNLEGLAKIFQSALSKELGYPVNPLTVGTEEHKESLDAVRAILTLNGYEKEREQLVKLLRPIIAKNQKANADVIATFGLVSEVTRKVLDGIPTDEIVAALPSANSELVRQLADSTRALQSSKAEPK